MAQSEMDRLSGKNYPDWMRNKNAPLAQLNMGDIFTKIASLIGGGGEANAGPKGDFLGPQSGGDMRMPNSIGGEFRAGPRPSVDAQIMDVDHGSRRHSGEFENETSPQPVPTKVPTKVPTQVPTQDGSMEAQFEAQAGEGMESGQYTVKQGDTLWDIAERVYGNGQLFQILARANGIKDPDNIQAGATINIPEIPMPNLRRRSEGEV